MIAILWMDCRYIGFGVEIIKGDVWACECGVGETARSVLAVGESVEGHADNNSIKRIC